MSLVYKHLAAEPDPPVIGEEIVRCPERQAFDTALLRLQDRHQRHARGCAVPRLCSLITHSLSLSGSEFDYYGAYDPLPVRCFMSEF